MFLDVVLQGIHAARMGLGYRSTGVCDFGCRLDIVPQVVKKFFYSVVWTSVADLQYKEHQIYTWGLELNLLFCRQNACKIP